jgi:SOS response regulatory protein OraA/RecX
VSSKLYSTSEAWVTDIIRKDKPQRYELIEQGILNEIPASAIDISKIEEYRSIKTQFKRPVQKMALPDSWRSSCKVSEISGFRNVC